MDSYLNEFVIPHLAATKMKPSLLPVRRGPVETTTGMIRVTVYVQQETEDRWFAKVASSSSLTYAGRTRREAIRLALQGASTV